MFCGGITLHSALVGGLFIAFAYASKPLHA